MPQVTLRLESGTTVGMAHVVEGGFLGLRPGSTNVHQFCCELNTCVQYTFHFPSFLPTSLRGSRVTWCLYHFFDFLSVIKVGKVEYYRVIERSRVIYNGAKGIFFKKINVDYWITSIIDPRATAKKAFYE